MKKINNKHHQNIFKNNLVGLFCASMLGSLPAYAQTAGVGANSLEEVVVTGRKREESLQDIPVSISVVQSELLTELNILDQGDLASLVPGFNYNQGIGATEDRNVSLPSIRGIGSTELATNRSKVATFVDGMPILGSISAINIGGSSQVEVYRGPQSAAFGRSTFAGAINYVTRDPGDQIEGSIGVNWSEDGTRILEGSVGGPITDTIGFQIGARIDDSESPDTALYSYTDGVEAMAETGENLSLRLVFEPNNKFKAKVGFARDTTDDGPRADFYSSAESSFECYNNNNPFTARLPIGPPNNIGWDGVFECDHLEVHPDTVLEQLNDYDRHFKNNPDDLATVVARLRSQGAMDGFQGLTVEEQALIVYDGYSVRHDDSGSESERNRFTAQFDYLFDNGSDVQLSLMQSEEDLFRAYSRIAEQEVQVFDWNPALGIYDNYAPTNNRSVPDNNPITIDENYLELRWASPADNRLRYVVGASYYDYEYIYTAYTNAGFSTIASGTSAQFEALTGIEVAPTTIQSEVTTNAGVFFNASYDFSDTITGSIEGRYASDEVGAVLPLAGLEDSVTTKSFTPRIALNYSPNSSTTYYVQYSVGVNPAGINAAMLDPSIRATLDNGIAVNDTIYGGSTNRVDSFVNYDSLQYRSFDEEELTNYEFGFKGSAFDGKLTYTGAIYYMEWENALQNINLDWDYDYADDDLAGTLITDNDPTGPAGAYYVPSTDFTSANGLLTNTGKSDTTGIELALTYQVNDRWSISANGSLMKREYTDYCSESDYLGFPTEVGAYAGLTQGVTETGNPCWVLDGLEVERQPSFTMTIIPRYRTELGNGYRFNASATLRHTAQKYADFANVQEDPAVTRVNLNLGIAKDNWSATLYINNLLDDTSVTPRRGTATARFFQLNAPAAIPPEYQYDLDGSSWGSFSFIPNLGRTFGVRARYDF